MVSSGSTGKTTLLLHFGICVALGLDWLGQPVKQGSTLLLSKDDEARDLLLAKQHLMDCMMLNTEQREIVHEKFRVVSIADMDSLMLVDENGKYGRKNYTVSDFARGLRTLVDEIDDMRCVILDTVRQLSGMDPSDDPAMRAFLAAGRLLAQAKSEPAVIMTHHVGKSAGRENTEDMYSAIGSSGLADSARFVWRLRNLTEEERDTFVHEDHATAEHVEEFPVLRLASTRGNIMQLPPPPIHYVRVGWLLRPITGALPDKTERGQMKKAKAADRITQEILDYVRAPPGCSQNSLLNEIPGKRDTMRNLVAAMIVDKRLRAAEGKNRTRMLFLHDDPLA
jgi:hypothetical protein